MAGMKQILPNAQHHAFMEELKKVGIKYAEAGMDPQEILALASQFVGFLMAFQDIGVAYHVLPLIMSNVQEGNRRAASAVMNMFGTEGEA